MYSLGSYRLKSRPESSLTISPVCPPVHGSGQALFVSVLELQTERVSEGSSPEPRKTAVLHEATGEDVR